jgi:hypothetical protein
MAAEVMMHRVIAALLVSVLTVGAAHSTPMQFVQQGPKLIGSGYAAPSPGQGTAVAISDGNTIIVGGPNDINPATGAQVGAAWVFTRTNGVWTQQGTKLVGTGAPGDAAQGTSVALSADGNTALVGGPADNATTGAAWVFTRANGVWSQQGGKLVGTGAIGLASQGQSVSLSADGNTALVGGPTDNSNMGAAWIFTRSSGVWNQTSKLVGSPQPLFAGNVALSGDGGTVIIASGESAFAYIFTNNGGVWSQQTSLRTSAIGDFVSVALSSSGNIAVIGLDGQARKAEAFARSGGVWSDAVGLVNIPRQSRGLY